MKSIAPMILFALSASLASADEPAPAADFSKMNWRLIEVDGARPDWEATLNLGEPGRIFGQAPCNRYSGTVTREGTSFVPGTLAATRMACLQIEGEAEFFEILGGITTAEQGPGSLTLLGGGHEMRFVQPID